MSCTSKPGGYRHGLGIPGPDGLSMIENDGAENGASEDDGRCLLLRLVERFGATPAPLEILLTHGGRRVAEVISGCACLMAEPCIIRAHIVHLFGSRRVRVASLW